MTAEVTVLVVDDHTLLVESLSFVLGTRGVTAVRPDLTSVPALRAHALASRADLVLLDLDLGGALGAGEDLIPPLLADGHRILVVSGSRDEARLGQCLVRGALGVVPKALPVADLVGRILEAASGGEVLSPARREELIAAYHRTQSRVDAQQAMLDRLSARERGVLEALADGQSVGRIAATFVLSEATVRTHVRSILTKLGVSSQLEAVAIAGRYGWFR